MIPNTPTKLSKHRILLDRLPENHPQYPVISDQFNRLKFGQIGEEKLTYYFNLTTIDSHFKMKGLRIEDQSPF